MNKKSIKKKMFKEKQEEFYRYQILEEYLKERIEQAGETRRRDDLAEVQRMLVELNNLLKFLK